MSEEATKTYNPTARRAGYLRWKSRQDGKTLTDEERQELADYEASVKGADAEAIAQLRGMSKTDVKNTTKDELLALAQRAKLDVSEESSKKDIEAAIAAM